jgi:c-di-GMP-binding flagellar brake protein YcgR
MSLSDKIHGDAIADVIAALIEDNTLIRINFKANEAERICVINSQRRIAGSLYFQIDVPEEIAVPDKEEEWRVEMAFDFMGRDRLNYSFSVTGAIISGKKLWIKLPSEIVRIQQRNNFRIDTPKRSVLELSIQEEHYALILENISLGGAFCRARRSLKKGLMALPVQVEAIIENLRLIIPGDDQPTEILVRLSRIARIVKDPDKRLLAYGIEFLEVGREEKARLTRIIYDLQRKFLKRRLK